MPSSQKFFYARPASTVRRSAVMTACLVIGITGFVIGFIANSRQGLGYECKYAKPKRVSVVWDTSSRSTGIGGGGGVGNGNGNGLSDGSEKRYKVMGFVGVYTGFGSAARRQALRQTWLPFDHQGRQRLEEATGLVFKFVIGRTSDKSKMSELRKEIAEYDDFLSLDIEEEYSELPYKTLAFFRAAYALYDSDFYVKADDDIYLRPDRLSLLLAKERSHSQTYVGCMKKGPVLSDPKQKWYEPMSYMLGKEYFLHAYGPIYALSAEVVASLVALRNDSFRTFSNEDVTIGAWMLAMNVKHEDNRQLCEPECTPTSIAVWDIPKCSGLCEPEKKLLQLHEKEICSKSPTQRSDDDDDD